MGNLFRSAYMHGFGYQKGFETVGKSRTLQSQKEEADINVIVKRFGVTGQLPQNVRLPLSGDFSNVSGYQDMQNRLIEANKAFSKMSSEVRARFQNDPRQFVDFCIAEKDGKLTNLDELRKMGLAVPEVVKQPVNPPA